MFNATDSAKRDFVCSWVDMKFKSIVVGARRQKKHWLTNMCTNSVWAAYLM